MSTVNKLCKLQELTLLFSFYLILCFLLYEYAKISFLPKTLCKYLNIYDIMHSLMASNARRYEIWRALLACTELN